MFIAIRVGPVQVAEIRHVVRNLGVGFGWAHQKPKTFRPFLSCEIKTRTAVLLNAATYIIILNGPA